MNACLPSPSTNNNNDESDDEELPTDLPKKRPPSGKDAKRALQTILSFVESFENVEESVFII